MTITRDIALTRLHNSRKALLDAIQLIDPGNKETIPLEGSWTAKDLLAHIETWERALLTPLEGYAAGADFQPEDIPDHDAWNANQASGWQALSLPQILDRLETTRRAIFETCSRLAPPLWEKPLPAPWGGLETLAEMLSGLAWHENQHVKSLRNLSIPPA